MKHYFKYLKMLEK